MQEKIKLGISTCLLGEKVRYDGGHKRDAYLVDILGQFVEWTPICPEFECGLTIPRESMRLVGTASDYRLVTGRSGIDHSGRMLTWAQERLDRLEQEKICGFIFKSKSPSSGMRDVKIYNHQGMPIAKGVGLFAQALMQRFPILPVEDEGRLVDAGLRENFIERIFVFHRWQKLVETGITRQKVVDFHTAHKLLLMAHSEKHMRELGRTVAAPHHHELPEWTRIYFTTLMEGLALKATVKKNVNVLQHILGFFKKQLSAAEKQEMQQVIDHYHQGFYPLIVPITLIRHYVFKYDEPYLKNQLYLSPHPAELMLRNHV